MAQMLWWTLTSRVDFLSHGNFVYYLHVKFLLIYDSFKADKYLFLRFTIFVSFTSVLIALAINI